MFASSADAKTSAGAPWVIWVTSAEDASKLNVALASGYFAVNAWPTSVKAAVSEAAANTVMSPLTAAAAVVGVAGVVGAAVVAAEPLLVAAACGRAERQDGKGQ